MLWTMCDPRHLSLSVAEAHVKQLTRVCMHTNTRHSYKQIHINTTHVKCFTLHLKTQFHYSYVECLNLMAETRMSPLKSYMVFSPNMFLV